MDQTIADALNVLCEEARDLYLPNAIPEVFGTISPIEFLREYVSKNVPVVFREATLEWPCVLKWNSNYFRDTIGNKLVNVAVTPNGYADGIGTSNGQEYFVMPEETRMPMSTFLDHLDSKSNPVYYIQTQNNNLPTDFPELLHDVDDSVLDFAREAFNKSPDAVNFWMGDERAITSMHKDPYENIYCVVSGYKDFILIPPTEIHNVPRKKYQSAVYETNSERKMEIKPLFDDDQSPKMIEWVAIDPLNLDSNHYKISGDVVQYQVRINAGDILYLPSLWYHHVQQSHKNISINFWFDMEYDSRYCYYKMVEKLCGFGS